MRILKFVIAASIISVTSVALVSHEFSTLQSWQISQKLNASFGISLNVESESLGVGVLSLGGVSVGGTATAEIASVVAQMNLNPFAKEFGRPSSVTLSDFSIELNPQTIQRLISRGSERKTGVVEQPSKNLPKRIEFERGNIGLNFFASHAPLRLHDVSGKFLTGDKHLVLKAQALAAEGKVIERNLTIDIRRDSEGRLRFEISRKSDLDQHRWYIKGFVSDDLQRAKLAFDLAGASQDVREYFSKYIVQTEGLKLAGKLDIRLLAGRPQRLQVDFEARARNLSVLYPIIDRQAVTFPPLYLAGRAILDPASRSTDVPRLEIAADADKFKSSSPKFIKLSAQISGISAAKTEVALELPSTDCADLLGVVPRTIAGELAEFKMTGKVSAKLKLSFGKALPFRIEPLPTNSNQINCEVVSSPEKFSKSRLRYSQSLRETSEHRLLLDSESSARTARFANLETLPEFVSKVFVAAEDRRFYSHSGFDITAIENAVQTNMEKSQTALGGSTISQQLAKNLFLSREKNLARKIRESFLTWYIERYLNKHRIMELYLNIAEFGPGIYGITQASKYYFDKEPQELSVRNAVFLGYLLPSPVKRAELYRRPDGRARVERIIDRRLRHFELATQTQGLSVSTNTMNGVRNEPGQPANRNL